MRYIRLMIIGCVLSTFGCGLKKPVEVITVKPEEKVSLFKDRSPQFELYAWNKTGSPVTFYIEALGNVWDYNSGGNYPNIHDSLAYDTTIAHYEATYNLGGYGFDHRWNHFS